MWFRSYPCMRACNSVYALIADPGGPSILATVVAAGLNDLSFGKHSTPVGAYIPAETVGRTGTYGCVPSPVGMRQGTSPDNGSCRLACLTVLIVTYWLFKKCLNMVTAIDQRHTQRGRDTAWSAFFP